MTTERMQIDWADVRQKLERNRQALERTMALEPERFEHLLRQRARRLMERHLAGGVDRLGSPVLVFTLSAQACAVALAEISEVLPHQEPTPLPGGPPGALGLINMRGEFLTVIDLARLLAIDRDIDGNAEYMLILNRDGLRLAAPVDAVDRIQNIRLDDLSPPPTPDSSTDPGAAYIKGVSTEQALIVIDGGAIVSQFMNVGESQDES
jgi:purine-binding chemotaxis protein CheW